MAGPPLAGKGTTARLVREKLLERGYRMCTHISTGEKLLKLAKEDNGLAALMAARKPAPDSTIMKIVEEALPEKGVLFGDGFPRTLAQAQSLVDMFSNRGWKMMLLHITPNHRTIMDRLPSRKTESPDRLDNTSDATAEGVEFYETTTLPALEYLVDHVHHHVHINVTSHHSQEDVAKVAFKELNHLMNLCAEAATLHAPTSAAVLTHPI